MNILHLSNTPVAGSPARSAEAISNYSHHDSRVITTRNYPNKLFRSPEGYLSDFEDAERNSVLLEAVRWADLLILHNVFDRYIVSVIENAGVRKPYYIQIHSPPGEPPLMGEQDIQFMSYKEEGILVVAQGYGRFFEDPILVPNIIPDFRKPELLNLRRQSIIVSNLRSTAFRWSKKVSEYEIEKIKDLCSTYNVPFLSPEKVPPNSFINLLSQCGHTVDDLGTGLLHQIGLEALKVGSIVYSCADGRTMAEYSQAVDCPPIPFVRSNSFEEIYAKMAKYFSDEWLCVKARRECIEFSQRFLSAERLTSKYLEAIQVT